MAHWLWAAYDPLPNDAALQYIGHDGRQVVVDDEEGLMAMLAVVSPTQPVDCWVRNRHVDVVDQAIARTSEENVDDSTGDRIVKISVSQWRPPAFLTNESPIGIGDVQRRSITPSPPTNENDSVFHDTVEAQFARRMVAEPYSLFADGEGVWIHGAPLRLSLAQLLRGPNREAVALDLTRALRSVTVVDEGGIGLDRSLVLAGDRPQARYRSSSPRPPPAYGPPVHDRLVMTASPPPPPPATVSRQVPNAEEPGPSMRRVSHSRSSSLTRQSLSSTSSTRQSVAAAGSPRNVVLESGAPRSGFANVVHQHSLQRCSAVPARYEPLVLSSSTAASDGSANTQAGRSAMLSRAVLAETAHGTRPATLRRAQRPEPQQAVTDVLEINLARLGGGLLDIHARGIISNRLHTLREIAARVASFYRMSTDVLILSYSPRDTALPSWMVDRRWQQIRNPLEFANMLKAASTKAFVEFAVLKAAAAGGHTTLGYGALRFRIAGSATPGVNGLSTPSYATSGNCKKLTHASTSDMYNQDAERRPQEDCQVGEVAELPITLPPAQPTSRPRPGVAADVALAVRTPFAISYALLRSL
ncbi:uncharacterized protein B0H18DRAFT_1124559 [Fomitopsis serialis]|uniref:uncharacterized protein n=1 Tax=Fomitopsis serialis TaxID=139415 RepID=UPI0020080306|nr:uncharacterized protein B0H18DRAFT_1124559 [Neoantrodia serialis]KAH9915876.1 hypothetical protein B0H18DRAFT_1124559 [Neoantrodia serialis]